MNDTLLKYEEKLNMSLRELYGAYGYLPFRMSRFEEYDLYVSNKSFLVSDSVITFTDTDGKLLALKPDVTLSIVKNCRPAEGTVEKLYYNENVFRVSRGTRDFREIMQTGLERIGDSFNNLYAASLTRRVNYNRIGGNALFCQLLGSGCGISANKTSIFYTVDFIKKSK